MGPHTNRHHFLVWSKRYKNQRSAVLGDYPGPPQLGSFLLQKAWWSLQKTLFLLIVHKLRTFGLSKRVTWRARAIKLVTILFVTHRSCARLHVGTSKCPFLSLCQKSRTLFMKEPAPRSSSVVFGRNICSQTRFIKREKFETLTIGSETFSFSRFIRFGRISIKCAEQQLRLIWKKKNFASTSILNLPGMQRDVMLVLVSVLTSVLQGLPESKCFPTKANFLGT